MTKPKDLPILGHSTCKRCGCQMPHQRCKGEKVRIACVPCKRQTFMTMEEYNENFGPQEVVENEQDRDTREPEGAAADAGSGAETEVEREPEKPARETDSSAGYFF